MKKKKFLMIGVDQAIPYLIDKFVEEEKLPNIKSLIEAGVKGEAYSCPPCDTPTNWTTIATGTTTAIHGATSFYMHIPGEPFELSLKKRSRTQLSRLCGANFIWNLADESGYIPFVINYPSGWPSQFNKGAMSLYTWPIPESLPQKITPKAKLIYSKYSDKEEMTISETEKIPFHLESEAKILQVEVELKYGKIIESKFLRGFIADKSGNGYDTFILASLNQGLIELNQNEQSDWISVNLKTDEGILPCLFRLTVNKISSNGDVLEIERTTIYNTKGWSSPDSFGEELIRNGIFSDEPQETHEVEYMISGEVVPYLDYARKKSLSLGKAIKYAKKRLNWDICFFHIHHLDSVNHRSLGPTFKKFPNYNEKDAEECSEQIEIAYKIVDELVGNLLESCVDKDTIVLFLADHGAIPSWKIANIPKALVEAGLLKYTWNQQEKEYLIDWTESKVFPYLEPPYIWINKKGRDPNGIVNESEFEEILDQVIDVLKSMKDPENGTAIVKNVVRKQDAASLGQNGERIGDIVYFLHPPYQIFDGRLDQLNAARMRRTLYNKPLAYDARTCFGAHAYYLPNETFGNYSISVPIIFSGPGISEGKVLNEKVNLTDIAPTIANLLNIPKPEQSEGRDLKALLI